MRPFLILFSVLIGVTTMVTACEPCGPSSEPSLHVDIAWTTPGKIDTLYAPGSQKPLITQPYATTELTNYSQFTVPLNLNADSSQYVFQQNGRQDTLTVFYKRNYSYRSTKCGYVLDLTPPSGPFARATQGKVESVDYEQTNYQRSSGFPSSYSETGIYLSLQL